MALDAVIRYKLLYGPDTAQINEAQMQRLDLFQIERTKKIIKNENNI